MSQPPKSTMRAPRARWLSLRTVFLLMAWPALRRKRPLSQVRRAGRRAGARPAPRCRDGSGRLRLPRHVARRHYSRPGAGRQVGAFGGPEGVADLQPAATVDDGLLRFADLADQLLGAPVQQRLVAGRQPRPEPADVDAHR